MGWCLELFLYVHTSQTITVNMKLGNGFSSVLEHRLWVQKVLVSFPDILS